LVDNAAFDRHQPIGYHPERPERLIAARAALAHTHADFVRIDPQEAAPELLERVHDARFVAELESLRGKRGMLDPDTFVSEKSIEAAKRAAGGAAEMVDRIVAKDAAATAGVALLRPPGHHARPAHAMGFCLVNNVAVAAAEARARGVERVAIVDYDVHHGNGTQEMFWRDPYVLYVSLHQFPFYPGTGAVEDVGEGEGRGYTVNVPLAAGGGDAVYRAAFDRIDCLPPQGAGRHDVANRNLLAVTPRGRVELLAIAEHTRDFGHGRKYRSFRLRGAARHHDIGIWPFALEFADTLPRLPHGFAGNRTSVDDNGVGPRLRSRVADHLRLIRIEPASECDDLDAHVTAAVKSEGSNLPANSNSAGPVIST